jgi:hypothetical protein
MNAYPRMNRNTAAFDRVFTPAAPAAASTPAPKSGRVALAVFVFVGILAALIPAAQIAGIL